MPLNYSDPKNASMINATFMGASRKGKKKEALFTQSVDAQMSAAAAATDRYGGVFDYSVRQDGKTGRAVNFS